MEIFAGGRMDHFVT